MLPYNNQEFSYNSLTTSYLSYHDFPAASHDSFLSQNQQSITHYQEPKLNNTNAVRIRHRSDRHSKIHTKQGLRDRRVRLSLEVAHKFFMLQDLLGFDKASSTVDWLINQSRVSIEQHLNVHFSDADCGWRELSSDLLAKKPQDITTKTVWKSKKERRIEARTRARERTMEKKRKLTVERNVEDVDDQCLFSNDVSKQSNTLDVAHYYQDLGRSNDDFMSSLYEQLNGNSFTSL